MNLRSKMLIHACILQLDLNCFLMGGRYHVWWQIMSRLQPVFTKYYMNVKILGNKVAKILKLYNYLWNPQNACLFSSKWSGFWQISSNTVKKSIIDLIDWLIDFFFTVIIDLFIRLSFKLWYQLLCSVWRTKTFLLNVEQRDQTICSSFYYFSGSCSWNIK